jgi:hypothetical protein
MSGTEHLKEEALSLVETGKLSLAEILKRAHLATRKCTCEGKYGIAGKVRAKNV